MKKMIAEYMKDCQKQALAYEELKTWYESEAQWEENDKLSLLVHCCDQLHLLHERIDTLSEMVVAHMCVYHGVCTPETVHEYVGVA